MMWQIDNDGVVQGIWAWFTLEASKMLGLKI